MLRTILLTTWASFKNQNFRKLPAVVLARPAGRRDLDGLGADGDGRLQEPVEGDALLVKFLDKDSLEVLDESVKASAALPTATSASKYTFIPPALSSQLAW